MEANRQGVDAPKDLMELQNKDITEGPTSNVCTKAFQAKHVEYKKVRGWQIGFAKEALNAVPRLPKGIMTKEEIETALAAEGKQPAPKSW